MPSHTASAIDAKTMRVSHDLTISGYSTIKHCYTGGTYIKSAKFVAGGRRWYLRYYPYGCSPEKSGDVTFLLYHDRDAGAEEDQVSVSYNIFLLGPDGKPVPGYERNHTMTYDEPPFYRTGLVGRTVLEQSAYLTDDSFSVRCEFRAPIIVTKTVLPPSEEPTLSSPSRTHVPADVNEGLIRFISHEVPMDVSVEVGDETFRAHRRFLAAQSLVFAALFTGPMRENTAPSVRIDDMEPLVFKAMLDFIYRGKMPPLDDEGDRIAMTQHLLVAANRYDLQRLKSICAEKLRTHINTSTVATTLELAQRHGCRALKDACFDFLAPPSGNLKAILKSEGFEQLIIDYPSVIVELLARVAPSPR
ncbi:hypothetical protein ACQ4PT_030488 [Festuca glaucescens]